MPVFTNALSIMSLSAGPPATNDEPGFVALTYTTIADVVNFGEAGATVAEILHQPVDTRVVEKFKGSINYGTRTVTMGKNITDAGHVMLIAGTDGVTVDTIHSLKIEESNGQIEYAQVRIMTYTRNHGSIDQIIGATTTLSLTNKIIDA